MNSNTLMSEQSRRRPLGVTLLGYLFFLMALNQVHLLVTKMSEFDTFLGFLAPVPFPQIEAILKGILFIILGVGLLRMERWGRWLLIGTLYLSLGTTLVGAVFGWINRGREQQIDEMFPGLVDTQASMQWLIQLILAGGILILLLLYSYRMKRYFKPLSHPSENKDTKELES